MKSVNPAVWVDKTADGRIAVSIPNADIIGRATVIEHCPKQEKYRRILSEIPPDS